MTRTRENQSNELSEADFHVTDTSEDESDATGSAYHNGPETNGFGDDYESANLFKNTSKVSKTRQEEIQPFPLKGEATPDPVPHNLSTSAPSAEPLPSAEPATDNSLRIKFVGTSRQKRLEAFDSAYCACLNLQGLTEVYCDRCEKYVVLGKNLASATEEPVEALSRPFSTSNSVIDLSRSTEDPIDLAREASNKGEDKDVVIPDSNFAFDSSPISTGPTSPVAMTSLPLASHQSPKPKGQDIPVPHLRPCIGAVLRWTVGEFYLTYPFHRHQDGSLPFHLSSMEDGGHTVRVKSTSCSGMAPDGNICADCAGINNSAALRRLRRSATNSSPFTNYQYKARHQLLEVISAMQKKLQDAHLTALDATRKSQNLGRALDMYKRFTFLVANSNIPRLRQLCASALRHGDSIQKIIFKLEQAAEGLLKTKGYEEMEYEVAVLVLRMGGPKLLYALNHLGVTPSLTATRKAMVTNPIGPSVAAPTYDEIAANISHSFSHIPTPPEDTRFGHSIQIDEIALEQRGRYDASNNRLVGLCREHAAPHDLTVNSISGIEHIADAIRDGSCCLAKEATVVVISRFAKEGYQPRPVLVSGTCKTELPPASAQWMPHLIKAWYESPDGNRKLGPIFSFASDGYPTRRKAFHAFLLKNKLSPTFHPTLFAQLGDLELMNLHTGPEAITMDFDPKHLFKRIATMIRSKRGILLAAKHLTSSAISEHLKQLPNMKPDEVKTLIDPSDPQDVGKAVRLLQAIITTSQLATDRLNPAQLDTRRALTLLGTFTRYLLDPFIDPTMSLAKQLHYLSAATHILFITFYLHGTGLMPGQLYHDIEAMIKNVYFSVAKQRDLNPQSGFWLCQVGSDLLENLFGIVRTVTHDRNVDILRLRDRLAAAGDIDRILAKHPQLDRGHRRLLLKGAEGVDHTNPTSWQGDVCVGSVCLRTEWTTGRSAAEEALRAAGVRDWEQAMQHQDVDMLRPQGVYVGVRQDEDVDITMEPAETSVGTATGSAGGAVSKVAGVEDEREIAEEGLTMEEAVEEMLETEEKPSHWLMLEEEGRPTKPVHKASVIRILLSPSDGVKSTDRLRRVRGFTRSIRSDGKDNISEDSGSTATDMLTIDGLVATVIVCDLRLCLAIVQVTNIIQDKMRHESIAMTAAVKENSKVELTGQILQLKMDGVGWVWTGAVETAPRSANGVVGLKSAVITFPASFACPVNPDPTTDPTALSGEETTLKPSNRWLFTHEQLQSLFQSLSGIPDVLKRSPRFKVNSKLFPYRNTEVKVLTQLVASPYSQGSLTFSEEKSKELKTAECCYQCGIGLKSNNARSHVGLHIFQAQEQPPTTWAQPIAESQPCGYCGVASCAVFVTKGQKATFTPSSQCERFHNFNIGSAARSSDTTPCTNRPMECKFCPKPAKTTGPQPAIWSYNMLQHIKMKHPNEKVPDTMMSEDERDRLKKLAAGGTLRRRAKRLRDCDGGGLPIAKRLRSSGAEVMPLLVPIGAPPAPHPPTAS